MFVIGYDIRIGNRQLQAVDSVSVWSSVDLVSDQCTIVLPASILNKPLQLEQAVKRGDTVTVSFGYDGNFRQEFTGYVKAIYQDNPARIECEDAAYLLRRAVPDKAFKNATAKQILTWAVDEVNKSLSAEQKLSVSTDFSGLTFDKFTVVRANGYEVIEKLKQESGVSIYLRGQVVHMHLAYTERRGVVTYDFAVNVRADSDLSYVAAQDQALQVRVVGRAKKGKKVVVEVGDKGGNVRTIVRPTISDKADLERIGKMELQRLKLMASYRGSIKSWLVPVCEIGYSATIKDPDYPARKSVNFVNSVRTEISRRGGWRIVSLGVPLSA